MNLTEVLTAGQVPSAEYVSARLTIDYSNANITADDGAGNAVPLKPVDANGNALTGTLTVTVRLDNANHLAISAAQIGRLALDFNLAASNTVDLTADTVRSPRLVASVVPPTRSRSCPRLARERQRSQNDCRERRTLP